MDLIVKQHDEPIQMEDDEYSQYSDEEYSDYSDEEYSEDEMEDSTDEESGKKEEVESDEDVISDRVEVDRGYTYMVEDGPTITRPKVATKTYFKRHRCYPLQHQLYRYEFPLSTFAKFALDRYNHIEHTKYEYFGLVKAYSRAVSGFRFWIRFKACLPDQDHGIYFQAILTKGFSDKIPDVISIDIEFVYPLPSTPVMPAVKVLTEKVSALLS